MDQHGLTLYHCICGTNSVEGGVHNHTRHNFAALNASPELADALIADFHHHHNFNCGSLHKHGKRYAGHYDPWLDHDLHKLREDIPWISKPAHQLIGPDTNPLDFSPTSEKFGIAMISSDTRVNCNFMGSDLQIQPSIQPVYTTKLHLSKLCGSQKDVYTFLSKAQETKFAVTPIHTKEEFELFFKAVSPGCNWCTRNKPQFEQMAYSGWWSGNANGKTIFYKLPEHLSTHYAKFS